MKIKNPKLEALFRAGKAPSPHGLLGEMGTDAEWSVTMVTGPIPNMGGPRFRHRKAFALGDNPRMVCGSNVLFDRYKWGWFWIKRSVYAKEDGGDDQPVLCIDYAVKGNGFITNRIRDHIRTTEDPDVLIGRFHYMLRGRLRFLGYFTLARIKAK